MSFQQNAQQNELQAKNDDQAKMIEELRHDFDAYQETHP